MTCMTALKKGQCEVTGIPFDMRQKPYRGMDFPFRASLDRTDNAVGYLPHNIQVVCKIYNQCKFIWNEEDVMEMAYALITEQHPHA